MRENDVPRLTLAALALLMGAPVCRFASATIKGKVVLLAMPPGLNPTRVRYCWGDGPVCTLYDSSRIPAVPFDLALSHK